MAEIRVPIGLGLGLMATLKPRKMAGWQFLDALKNAAVLGNESEGKIILNSLP